MGAGTVYWRLNNMSQNDRFAPQVGRLDGLLEIPEADVQQIRLVTEMGGE